MSAEQHGVIFVVYFGLKELADIGLVIDTEITGGGIMADLFPGSTVRLFLDFKRGNDTGTVDWAGVGLSVLTIASGVATVAAGPPGWLTAAAVSGYFTITVGAGGLALSLGARITSASAGGKPEAGFAKIYGGAVRHDRNGELVPGTLWGSAPGPGGPGDQRHVTMEQTNGDTEHKAANVVVTGPTATVHETWNVFHVSSVMAQTISANAPWWPKHHGTEAGLKFSWNPDPELEIPIEDWRRCIVSWANEQLNLAPNLRIVSETPGDE